MPIQPAEVGISPSPKVRLRPVADAASVGIETLAASPTGAPKAAEFARLVRRGRSLNQNFTGSI